MEQQSSQSPRKTILHRLIIFAVFTFLSAGLIGAGFFIWKFFSLKMFPAMQDGTYYGEIVFGEQRKLPFFVEITKSNRATSIPVSIPAPPSGVNSLSVNEPSKFNAVILQEGWGKGVLVGFDQTGNALTNTDSYLEFSASATTLNNQQKIKLYGSANKADFSGEALDVIKGTEGDWSLKRIEMIGLQNSDSKVENPNTNSLSNSKPLLSLFAQFETLKDKQLELQTAIDDKTKEVSSLKDFMLSEKKDKSDKAEKGGVQQINTKEQELKELTDKINSQREIAKQLNAQFQVAQKLIPSGRLTLLARDTLALEGKYLDTLMKGLVFQGSEPDVPPDLVAKGEVALKMRNEIEAERGRIRELAMGGDSY